VHGNARLTPVGRLTMVLRIESGRPVAHVAAEMGISRPTAYKWWRRWQDEGIDGLQDRSSRAHSCPHRTPPALEAAILELRQVLKLGPVRIGDRLGGPVPAGNEPVGLDGPTHRAGDPAHRHSPARRAGAHRRSTRRPCPI
jgi:transposase-like protein